CEGRRPGRAHPRRKRSHARVRARLTDNGRARVSYCPGEPGDDSQLRLPPDPGPALVVLTGVTHPWARPASGRLGGTMFRSEYADASPVDLPIHDAVLARAAEFGDIPALIDGTDGTDGTTLTYEQVDRFHRRVAAGLAEAGLRKGDVLALHSPNTINAAVIGVYNEDGNEVPHAFVVRQPSAPELAEGEVMMYVAEHVAPYKRVRHVTFIDGVPRAASGEILRRELR